jgi:hypothetical protein
MPWVGFEPTIPASERAKTVHTLRQLSYRDRPNLMYYAGTLFEET